MNLFGEQETSDIISVNSYLGTLLIGILPIIGDILLIRWSNSNDVRINKQNLCKAFIKLKLIIIYPSVLLLVAIIILLVLNIDSSVNILYKI